jgi:hypothetical protein
MPNWKNVGLWDDVTTLQNVSGKYYYRKAIITWSEPIVWPAKKKRLEIPENWIGHGGIYAFLRDNRRQNDRNRISYVGVAEKFEGRLHSRHPMYPDLVEKRGQTKVSLGRIKFDRIRAKFSYYEEIEEIVAWSVWPYLRNIRGLESLPGFRGSRRPFKPWIIENHGYGFGRMMAGLIAYPSIATADRI